MFQARRSDNSKVKSKKPNKITQHQKEEHVEKTIQLPADVNMMGKALKKLYLELLYTQEVFTYVFIYRMDHIRI
jgi:hypothetical protein